MAGIGANLVFNQLLTFNHHTVRGVSLVGQSLLKLFHLFLILFILASNLLSFYHHETVEAWDFDKNTQLATFVGRYLQDRKDKDFKIYFLGNSKMYFKAIPTLPFLTKKEGEDIFDQVEKFLHKIKKGEKLVFIIIPERKKELEVLEKYFQEAKRKDLHNPKNYYLGTVSEVEDS